jgi:hypothetical protein
MIRREEDGVLATVLFQLCTSATQVITQREWNYPSAQLFCFCPPAVFKRIAGGFSSLGITQSRQASVAAFALVDTIDHANHASFRIAI